MPAAARLARPPKVAIVTDWLTDFGGAERVLLAWRQLYPEAPIFTTFYRPENLPQFAGADVRTSYLQKIPGAARRHRLFYPLMPAAVEQFDLDAYDIVLSSSSTGCSKGVITRPETLHVCYCHNPSRALWDGSHGYGQLHSFNPLARLLIPGQLKELRIWDRCAADRVDVFLANSETVAKRIAKYYQREATVLHPPVDCAAFAPAEKVAAGEYFLAVGRWIPYKRFDLVIAAANKLGVPLKIVGGGPEEARLRQLAGPTVELVGRVSEEELKKMYAECRALIFPQLEDFGLTAVEVQAAGRPVVAYRAGGALETVVPNRTGIFFAEQTVESLADALQKAAATKWVPATIRKNAARFDLPVFQKKFAEFVAGEYEKHRARFG